MNVDLHAHTTASDGAASPGVATMFGTVRSGIFRVRAKSSSQRGRTSTCGAYRRAASKSIFSGMNGLPQSRP